MEFFAYCLLKIHPILTFLNSDISFSSIPDPSNCRTINNKESPTLILREEPGSAQANR